MLEKLTRSEREKLLAIVRTAFPGGRKSTAVGPIPRAEPSGALPLSFAQQRLWFLARLEGVSRVYHISGGFRLAGALDRGALRGALNRIVERHEALRTTFQLVDGEPVQRIAAIGENGFALIEQDLRGDAEAERELERIVREEARGAFDLESGPLIRGRLVRLEDEGGEERHALLVTMHHIVSDGWSMGVMAEELSALYGAYREGKEDPLPELEVQYGDYAVWQRRRVEGDLLRRQAEYWKGVLAGAPAVLELPTDRPRPRQQDYAGATVEAVLDERLTAGLKALSRRQGVTLYMTLLAGWAAVLSRLSGQREVVIGTPTANRGHVQVEGLIGVFVNTLGVLVDLWGRVTGEELLERVKEQVVGAQANQDIPFEQVVEMVQPVRSTAHSPVFQVMFGWEATPPAALALPGLRVMPLGGEGSNSRAGGAEAEAVGAKFDLTLGLREQGGKIVGGFTYATALYEKGTMERHVGYLRKLLEGLVGGAKAAVEGLPMLSEAEREQVLHGWNRTEAEYERDRCIHELFEEQAAGRPGAAAVEYEGASLSYGELNRRANRLAHYLRGLGVGPGERVALCVERGMEMMVGLMGVLKAGGAYVPLDPEYPEERLRLMLEDSAPVALLTQGHLRGLFADQELTIPVIELEQEKHWENLPEGNPDRIAGFTARHPAYVIYTSGSSGAPKGVVVEHESVVNLLNWTQSAYPLSADGAVLQNAPIGFDASVTGFFWPLVTGARVVMAREEGHKDAAYLCQTIRRNGVTAIGFPISMLPVFAEAADESGGCPTLAHVMCGGEALPAWVVRQFQERLPQVELHNLYGPTEATVASTAWTRSGEDDLNIVPIGKPIANSRIYILDGAGEPAPVGVTGEMYIGGVGVARGYLNRPELTAERFVADPFASEPGARMYRTGDLGRWLADGNIEFLGRNDFQVKIRGFRIELGEIEARLREHVGVGEAVVVAREDEPGEKRLVAYYTVSRAGVEVSVEALRAHLLTKLPEYMLPSAWLQLDALPLTPNGKLDQKALPAPCYAGPNSRLEYEEPEGELESQIAGIWAEILTLDRVGRQDNFFELGGHSLLGVRMMSRLRRVSGREVEIRQLFAHPVLCDLAKALDGAVDGRIRTEQEVIPRAERRGALPLSFAQRRMWFRSQLEGLSRAFHIPGRFRLVGALDRGALGRALNRIVERHEALRTTFQLVDGEPVQRVAPIEESSFALIEQDLRGQAEAERELERIVREEAGGAFDLEKGPLIRGRLIRLEDESGEERHALLLTVHHIVSDGWSIGVMGQELSSLYGAYREGKEDPLPELEIQYGDYAVWQRRRVEGELLERQAGYWKAALAGAPVLELPTNRPRPRQQDYAGAMVEVVLDEELTAGLKTLSQRRGVTLYMTLLAGWAAVLGRLSGQTEVVIGSPDANRRHVQLEGLIGFFVNNLVVSVDLRGSPTGEELLERVKERTVAAQANQDIPFEQVVELVQPGRSTAHSPVFQAMFAWENTPRARLALAGLQVLPLRGDRAGGGADAEAAAAKWDVTLGLREQDGKIVGGLTYATALYERETIELHVEYLRNLLQGLVADASTVVEQLPMLAPAAQPWARRR
jgi:amino acid adenylation domain-containing protein